MGETASIDSAIDKKFIKLHTNKKINHIIEQQINKKIIFDPGINMKFYITDYEKRCDKIIKDNKKLYTLHQLETYIIMATIVAKHISSYLSSGDIIEYDVKRYEHTGLRFNRVTQFTFILYKGILSILLKKQTLKKDPILIFINYSRISSVIAFAVECSHITRDIYEKMDKSYGRSFPTELKIDLYKSKQEIYCDNYKIYPKKIYFDTKLKNIDI